MEIIGNVLGFLFLTLGASRLVRKFGPSTIPEYLLLAYLFVVALISLAGYALSQFNQLANVWAWFYLSAFLFVLILVLSKSLASPPILESPSGGKKELLGVSNLMRFFLCLLLQLRYS